MDGSDSMMMRDVVNHAIAEMVRELMRRQLPFSLLRSQVCERLKRDGHFLLSCDRIELSVKLRPSHEYVSRIIILYYPLHDQSSADLVEVQEPPRYTSVCPISTW